MEHNSQFVLDIIIFFHQVDGTTSIGAIGFSNVGAWIGSLIFPYSNQNAYYRRFLCVRPSFL